MGDAQGYDDQTLRLAAFDYLPTPIVILSDVATVVLANHACRTFFQKPKSLIGKHVSDLPIHWQDGDNDVLRELLASGIGNHGVTLDHPAKDQTPNVLKLHVEIHDDPMTCVWSARLLVTGFQHCGRTFQALTFENVRESHKFPLPSSRTELDPFYNHKSRRPATPNESRSVALGSRSTSQEYLDSKFAQLRDAIFFNNEDKAGFLLSADESFCYPNYRGSRNAAPVEIDDIGLFFQDWDVWDPHFTAKQPLSEFPSLWLNRQRTKFRNRRYGLKEEGKDIVIEASGDPLFDPASGEYIGGVVWITTLGEYANVAAQDLKAALADFQTICDRLPHLLWTVDAEGKADYFSQSWYDFTGLSEEESLGLEFQNAINPEDMQRIWSSFIDSSAQKAECHAEARYRRHDGQWIWMSVRAKPLLDKNGEILKWYGSSTDINNLAVERLRAERQKNQMMDMLSLAEVGLFEVSSTWKLNVLEGRMSWLNDERISQLSTKSIDGKDGGLAIFSGHLRNVMSGKDDFAVFEENIGCRWYKFRLVSDAENSDSLPVSKKVFGCSVDVTEQRERAILESENARLVAEAALETEKSRLKTAFLAHMSHEVRTPIAGIIGTAEILAESCRDSEQRGFISDIQLSANNLLVIVNDILDLSKIEAGQLKFEATSFDINDLVLQVNKLFKHSVRDKALQITIHQKGSHNSVMNGDPGRVRQILTNLVSNAVKFTSEGSIDVTVLTHDSSIHVCVEDTGEGIDAPTMSMLFKPFVQGDASTARRHGGTGLGLTISRNLAELMGGTLTLNSTSGHGTTATLTLPRQIAVAGLSNIIAKPFPSDLPSRELPVTNVASDMAKPSDHRILVVEDNAINQKVALNLVRKLGYYPDAVWNGQEALDYVEQRGPPSLVLMDCQMPLLDGYEATRRLRTDEKYHQAKSIPIIALTASAIQGDKEKCHAAGMDDYLSKPVSRPLLKAMLEKWIPSTNSDIAASIS